ncbi:hypothetical protein HDU80_007867 [Chytriomyces hyalinus]|nr:hypothetical protein HDU80_007867 [Chytriomyces hyalinus]
MNLFALKDPMKHFCEDAVTSASNSNMSCVLTAIIHFYLLYVMLLWISVYLVNLHLKIVWHINFFVDKYVYLQIVWVLPVAMLLPVAFDKKSQFIAVGKECYPRGPLMDPMTPAPECVGLKKDVVRKGFCSAKRAHTPTIESSQTGKVQDVEEHRRHQRVDFITQLKENWRTLALSLTFSLVTLFSLTYFFQFYQLSGGISAKQPWVQEWYSCLLLNNGREACQYIASREAPNLAMDAAALERTDKELELTKPSPNNNSDTGADGPLVLHALNVAQSLLDVAQVKRAVDVLKETTDTVTVNIEALCLARSRPAILTNPNARMHTSSHPSYPTQLSTNRSQGIEDAPLFWRTLNMLWLRAIASPAQLPDVHMSNHEWDWIEACIMDWCRILEWYGLVDFESGQGANSFKPPRCLLDISLGRRLRKPIELSTVKITNHTSIVTKDYGKGMSDQNLSGKEVQKPDGSATRLEDFRLMCKLGEGTFSEVLKVKHKRTGQISAMKRFRKHFNSFEEIEGLREIQALRRLNPHPHIVDLEDVIFEPRNGVLSLNFELMDCNLYELISRKNLLMTESKAKMYMHQICKGLEYIHGKGIFHRDIKPENILVKDFNIKIADFGSCRGIHSKQPYTEYIATRWYRPPECLLCDGIYTFKMDIWSAGCVLYEVISKAPLFPGANELDQIHRIHNIMGTPSPKLLKQMLGNRASSPKFQFTPKEGTGIKTLLPYVSQECLDIIHALLIYNPDDRISAKEALKHAFFKDINSLKATNSISQDSLQAVGKLSTSAKPSASTKAEPPGNSEAAVSSTYMKTKDIKEEHPPSLAPEKTVSVSNLVTVAESSESIDTEDKPATTNHQHRPKGKEIEPQQHHQSDTDATSHHQKPPEPEHVHLPAIGAAHTLVHTTSTQKPHPDTEKHVKHADPDPPLKQHTKTKSEQPSEHSDLFIGGHQPDAMHSQTQPHAATNQKHSIPSESTHLPHITHPHINPQHQAQIQKQFQLQQNPAKVQHLQPLTQSLLAHQQQMASDESIHQNQQSKLRSESETSNASATLKEANIPIRRRGGNEKKAAEAVLARARRIQQVGTDIKRNPMLGHKLGRLHVNNVVGTNETRSENSAMFGVVGKIAPNNNTKFPVLSFAPPPSNSYNSMPVNAQSNLPPLLHQYDSETKTKHKIAQGHLAKDSVMLPSLTDKSLLKLGVVPAGVENTAAPNLPSLKRK